MRRWGRVAEKRRTLDLEEVEAALKRAAWNAVHGPPEVRAGRFVRHVVAYAAVKTPVPLPGVAGSSSEAVRKNNEVSG
jgi:hypothetical protein